MYDRRIPAPEPVPYFSEHDLEQLKRKAKQLKRDKPQLTHTQALDLIAKSYGFTHWKVLQKNSDDLTVLKQLAKLPVIAIFDLKDYMSFEESAYDETWWQASESLGDYLLPQMYKHYCEHPPECDLGDDGTLDMPFEYFVEASSPAAVFPAVTPENDDQIEAFMKELSEKAFFVPMYIIKKGIILDLFSDNPDQETERVRKIFGLRIGRPL